MTEEEARMLCGGAYCAGFAHGRISGLREYEVATYWPMLLDPVVSAYCKAIRLDAKRYTDAAQKANELFQKFSSE